MVRRKKSILLLTTLVLVFTPNVLVASDDIVHVPLGWELDPLNGPFDIGPEGIAFVVYRYEDERRVVTRDSQVIQTSGETIVGRTELPHRVVSVEYSPDGETLIAHQWTPEHRTGEWLTKFRVFSLDRDGRVNWTVDESRHLRFSGTGEVLYSFWNNEFTLRDLAGNRTRTLDLREHIPRPGLFPHGRQGWVSGNGDRVVVLGRRTVVCLSIGPDSVTEQWRVDFKTDDEDATGIRHLSDDRFLIDQAMGRFMVVDASGLVLYRHYLEANVTDECGDRVASLGENVFPGDTPNCLIVFNGQRLGMAIDLRSRDVHSCVFPVHASSSAVVRRKLAHGRFVVMYPTQVRTRQWN